VPRFPPNPERRPAVVTGASSGIGRAVAASLAAAGHPVVLGARRSDQCDEVAASIREGGGDAVAFPLDLVDAASVDAFAAAAGAACGEIEIVVSNAGMNRAGAVLDTTPDDLRATLDVNVEGTHRLVRALVPPMVARRRGDVVFVTSDVAERPRPAMAAYVTSKWGLEGYVRSLQMELEGTGVRASIVRPGPTLTGMGMDWDPELTASVIGQWAAWGFARHASFMRPPAVAEAVLAVVSLPRGVHATTLELQPEAPIREEVR
jgi:NADP-dependent 3-hydroxy acid dehydrogenase YdfG